MRHYHVQYSISRISSRPHLNSLSFLTVLYLYLISSSAFSFFFAFTICSRFIFAFTYFKNLKIIWSSFPHLPSQSSSYHHVNSFLLFFPQCLPSHLLFQSKFLISLYFYVISYQISHLLRAFDSVSLYVSPTYHLTLCIVEIGS